MSSDRLKLWESTVNFYVVGIPKSRNLDPAGADYPYQWVSSVGIVLLSACGKEDTVWYQIKHIKVKTCCLKCIEKMFLGLIVLSHYLVSLHWINHLQGVGFRQLRNFWFQECMWIFCKVLICMGLWSFPSVLFDFWNSEQESLSKPLFCLASCQIHVEFYVQHIFS